ncbi:MAG: aldehyde ferredoxin oxidoreductase [Firmicutes bacterium]|nr:aldehyde ferredoxin oxidoreductase [Bacillota bacterium]
MSRVIRVNVKNKEISQEQLREEYRFFGGRGLIAKIMTDEVDPSCDPLGAGNKLILCTGLLAGSNIPTAHRLSVGGKSPLTGGIKEANSGGTAAYAIARHGIKAIILEDLPAENDPWQILRIKADGKPELIPADQYVGLNNYALVEKLKERFGNKTSCITIGRAGEWLYRNSSLQVTDFSVGYPTRSAARGGLGAIMGSKKIKAIIIEESSSPHSFPYHDKELVQETRKKLVQNTLNNPARQWVMTVGTPALVDRMGATGFMPVRNFSGEIFEKLENISTQVYLKRVEVGGGKNSLPCQPGCILRCSGRINDSEGNFVTSGLEYETIALCGANCDIDDMETIIQIDRLCDDLGVDTIETGVTIGICMEAGKIPWGDSEAALSLIREMMEGTELGRLLGQGAAKVGAAFGVKRIPAVKGQAMSGYDSRNIKGVGVTYATSPMGADHTAGLTMQFGLDPLQKEGQVDASIKAQISSACQDNFVCMFGWGDFTQPDILPNIMKGLYGGDWDMDKIMEIGKETLKLEVAFNKAAGFTEEDNKLPEFFRTMPSPATGSVFDIDKEDLAMALDAL